MVKLMIIFMTYYSVGIHMEDMPSMAVCEAMKAEVVERFDRTFPKPKVECLEVG